MEIQRRKGGWFRGDSAEEVQRRCRGIERVPRRCRGIERVPRRCRGIEGEEEVQGRQ